MWITISILLFIIICLINIIKFRKSKTVVIKNILNVVLPILLSSTLYLTGIFNLLSPLDKFNHKPILNAKIFIGDIENDSLKLSFDLTNEDEIPAKKIRYFTLFKNYLYGNAFDIHRELQKGKPVSIDSKFQMNKININEKFVVELFVIYDIESKDKTETYYTKFIFSTDNLNTKRQYLNPDSSSTGIKLANVDSLLSILNCSSTSLAHDSGYQFFHFIPAQIKSDTFTFLSAGDKAVTYIKYDNAIYFTRTYIDSVDINISQELSNKDLREKHGFRIIWGNYLIRLSVDSQNYVTDSISRIQFLYHPSKFYSDYGIFLYYKRKYDQAIKILNKSIALDNINNYQTYEYLFYSYANTNQIHLGIKSLEKAIEVGHRDSIIVLNLAVAYINTGEIYKGIECYKLDNKINKSFNGFLRYSNLLIKLEKCEEGEKLLKSALKYYPNSAMLNCNLGKILFCLGKQSLAKKYFDKSFILDSLNPSIAKDVKTFHSFFKE